MRGWGPRFLSLGTKLALGTLSTLLVVSAFLATWLASRERASLLAAKTQAAEVVAELLSASLVAPLDFSDSEAIQLELERVSRGRDASAVAVWGPSGLVGARGSPAAERAPALHELPVYTEAYVEVMRPVLGAEGRRLGVLLLRYSLARENASYERARVGIMLAAAAVALATAATLIWLARRQIVAPLSTLVDAARLVEQGEQAPASSLANDEIGQLGEAFNRMAAAIADRERRLAAATRELQTVLDHTGQGILIFSDAGVVEGGRSREASHLFGAGLEGKAIAGLLYPAATPGDIEARAFREWLDHAPHVPAERWEEFRGLAPAEVSLPSGGGPARVLSLDFRRLPSGDGPPRVMLIATDVSAQRALERTVEAQREQMERQAARAQRLLASGHLFGAFSAAAREALRDGREPGADATLLLQNLHTMKGESSSFGLDQLADAIHQAEAALAGGAARQAEALDRVEAALREAEAAFEAAAPAGRAALEQIPVRRADLEALARLAERQGGELAALASRATSRPFGECAHHAALAAPLWARRADKQAHVWVHGRDQLVPGPLARVLPGILSHLVRNAIAHGVEPPEQREALGKPAAGSIQLRCEQGPEGVTVSVEDDGPGIDAEALRAAGASGSLDEMLFRPGASTARQASDLAGRGVGLAAARRAAAQVGYTLRLVTPHPARFVLSPVRG